MHRVRVQPEGGRFSVFARQESRTPSFAVLELREDAELETEFYRLDAWSDGRLLDVVPIITSRESDRAGIAFTKAHPPLAVSENRKFVVSLIDEDSVGLFDTINGNLRLRVPLSWRAKIAVSEQPPRLAIASFGGRLTVYDIGSEAKLLLDVRIEGTPLKIDFIHQGTSTVLQTTSGQLKIYDTFTGARLSPVDFKPGDKNSHGFATFESGEKLYLANPGGAIAELNLRMPPLPKSKAAKLAWFELLTGYAVDDEGRCEMLTEETQSARWELLRNETDWRAARKAYLNDRIIYWHALQVRECLSLDQEFAANFHLKQLKSRLKDEPDRLTQLLKPIERDKASSDLRVQLQAARDLIAEGQYQDAASLLTNELSEHGDSNLSEVAAFKQMLAGLSAPEPSGKSDSKFSHLLFDPDVVKPGDSSWNRIFAACLLGSTTERLSETRNFASQWDSQLPTEPNGRLGKWVFGWIDACLGNHDQAIETLEPVSKQSSHDFMDMMFYAKALRAGGRNTEANIALLDARRLYESEWQDGSPKESLKPEIRRCMMVLGEHLDELQRIIQEELNDDANELNTDIDQPQN